MGLRTQMGFVFCDEKLFSPLLTPEDAKCAVFNHALRSKVVALGLHHAELLDYLNDRYRDWPGRFYDRGLVSFNQRTSEMDEVFVNMDPLYEAAPEWWRDTFSPKAIVRPILRIRKEALPRWCAIGSLFYAWYPHRRPAWLGIPANDNEPSSRK